MPLTFVKEPRQLSWDSWFPIPTLSVEVLAARIYVRLRLLFEWVMCLWVLFYSLIPTFDHFNMFISHSWHTLMFPLSLHPVLVWYVLSWHSMLISQLDLKVWSESWASSLKCLSPASSPQVRSSFRYLVLCHCQCAHWASCGVALTFLCFYLETRPQVFCHCRLPLNQKFIFTTDFQLTFVMLI